MTQQQLHVCLRHVQRTIGHLHNTYRVSQREKIFHRSDSWGAYNTCKLKIQFSKKITVTLHKYLSQAICTRLFSSNSHYITKITCIKI